MSNKRIVLSFPPDTVEEPITYRLIKDYDLKVNILRASIDPGKQGRMVVELTGEEAQLSRGFSYMENLGVKMEPLAREIQHQQSRCTSCTACVPICPTGALNVDRKTWLVSYDAEKCVVCYSCVDVCIYNAIDIFTP